MRKTPLRVAFFTDCFHEVNGVALTSRQLEGFARRRKMPFFSLHIGPETKIVTEQTVTVMELKRSRFSVALDAGMYFDLLGMRHWARVRRALREFQPDLIHITGPGDCGLLGLFSGMATETAAGRFLAYQSARVRLAAAGEVRSGVRPGIGAGSAFRAHLVLQLCARHPGSQSRVDRDAQEAHAQACVFDGARHRYGAVFTPEARPPG